MRKIGFIALALMVVLFLGSPALAKSGIDLPVKYSQAPWDYAGTDWLSDIQMGQVMADDFSCIDPTPIVAVRWWGSYLGEQGEPGGHSPPFFDISFYQSVGPHPISLPVQGPPVYLAGVQATEVWVGNDASGTPVYQYEARIMPFDQYYYSQTSPNPNKLWISINKFFWGWLGMA